MSKRVFKARPYAGLQPVSRSLLRAQYTARRRAGYAPMSFAPRVVRSFSRGETKYFDCGFNVSVTTAGTTWADTEVPMDNYINASGAAAAYTDSCLIPTAQGSAYGQIEGQRYLLKKLRVRGAVIASGASDLPDVMPARFVRILLVMDMQPNGAQAQGEDIMQDTGELQENMFSFQRTSTQTGRFRILKDKFITLNPGTAGTDGASTVSANVNSATFKFSYAPRNGVRVQVRNGNSTPTVAGTIDCNIFMLAYCYGSSTVQSVTLQGCSRAYFCE